MTLDEAQALEQASRWVAGILGSAVIAVIYLYEKYSRQKKQ